MKHWINYYDSTGYHGCGSSWTLPMISDCPKTLRGKIRRALNALPNMGTPGNPAVCFQITVSQGFETENAITSKIFA